MNNTISQVQFFLSNIQSRKRQVLNLTFLLKKKTNNKFMKPEEDNGWYKNGNRNKQNLAKCSQ